MAESRTLDLNWPRSAEDGTPLGVDLAAKHRDVRLLTLALWRGSARAIDAEDIAQEVLITIARRNRMPCAYDPRKGSLGKYVYQVATHAISNMLESPRWGCHESLAEEPEHLEEVAAAEPVPADAPLDLDDAPLDPEDREDYYAALCCLHELGQFPSPVPLWRLALDQRETPQLSLLGPVELLGEYSPQSAPPRADTRLRRDECQISLIAV